MLPRTRKLLAHQLVQAISVADSLLSLDACASLVMALAGDPETSRMIHSTLISRICSVSSNQVDWRLAALHLWASAPESSYSTWKLLYLSILASIGRETLVPGYVSPDNLAHLCSPIGDLQLDSRSCIRGAVAVLNLAVLMPGMNSRRTVRDAARQTAMALAKSDIPQTELHHHLATVSSLIPSPSRHRRSSEMPIVAQHRNSLLRLLVREDQAGGLTWIALWRNPEMDIQDLQCIASELADHRRRFGYLSGDLAEVVPPSYVGRGIFAITSSANFEILREFSIHLDISSSTSRAESLREGLSRIPAQDWETFTPYRNLDEFSRNPSGRFRGMGSPIPVHQIHYILFPENFRLRRLICVHQM